MRREAPAFLWDALDAAKSVRTFVADQTWDSYVSGSLLQAAVERKLEVAGEALNKLRKAVPATEDVPNLIAILDALLAEASSPDSEVGD